MRGRLATSVVVALASLATTAGGIAVSLVASDQWPGWLQPYRRWGWWAVLGLALAAAGLAVWQARRQAGTESGTTMATSVVAVDSGAVGGHDVSVTGGVGPTAGRDATWIVGGLGPTAARDMVIHHHYPPGVPVAERIPEARKPGPVSNLPPRNPNFTGRRQLLENLARNLWPGSVAAIVGQPPSGQVRPTWGGAQALVGMGGVGKSELALEYAHAHAADYDLRWWIPSEEPLAIPAALAALARRMGLDEQADQVEIVAQVMGELGNRDRWLLIFDNAMDPGDLARYQPSSGGGHVLVTTRNRAFGGVAARLEVGVFDGDEAAGFLLGRTGSSDRAAAEVLAGELGELPLALEQAAAFVEQTGLGLTEYLVLYRQNRERLLAKGEPVAYGATVDATFRLAIGKTAERSQAAVELLELCAFLAPEAVPHQLLAANPEALPAALSEVIQDQMGITEAVGVLHGYSLLERDQVGIRVHQLVQAVTRHRLAREERARWAARAVALIRAGWSEESWLPANWPWCGQLLPHALVATDHAEELATAREDTAALLDRVGVYLWGRAELTDSRAILQRALTMTEAAYGPDHPNVAITMASLGLVVRDLGELPAARAYHERALAIFVAAYGPDHLEVAHTLNNLGVILGELGELPQARARLERALAIRETAYGPDRPEFAAILKSLGTVLVDLGELRAARDYHERALAIFEAAYGPNHPHVAITLNGLGLVLAELGELPAARACYERALAIDEAVYGPNHPDVAAPLNNIGNILAQLGELPVARAYHERALAIFEAAYGPNHPKVAQALGNLGNDLRKLGELPAARAHHERALAIFEAAYGSHHLEVARALDDLGNDLRRLGERRAAKVCKQRAHAIRQKLGWSE